MADLPEAEASEAEVCESGREWWEVRSERQAEALSGCLLVTYKGGEVFASQSPAPTGLTWAYWPSTGGKSQSLDRCKHKMDIHSNK